MAISTSPYDWVRTLKPHLKELDAIPLTGTAPSFPWEELSDRLSAAFENETFCIRPGEIAWRSKEALFEGLEESPKPFQFTLPSLQGNAWWLIPNYQLLKLGRSLLTDPSHRSELLDEGIAGTFTQFLLYEILFQIEQLPTSTILSPVLNSVSSLPNEDALCLEIMISIDGQAILSRLVISPELRQSWVEYHQQHYERSVLYEELAKIVDVTLHIEVGKTELTLQEWSTVELGDCILLDHCSLKNDTLEGKVVMTIDRREALRAKLKDGNLKILELPIFHEVDIPMDEQNEHDDEDEDEDLFSDLEFPEEDNDDEDFNDFDEDEDLISELDEDHLEEEGVSEEISEAAEAGETETTAELAEEKAEFEEPVMAAPVEEEKGPMTPGEIPVTVVIEAGCVQMTMDQLLQLEPGNLLELNIRPESGVDLTINGKIVGKGELIKLGETLGVRVLKLGRRQL
jgi:flagellar motor switch protein FliN/FliY